MFKTVEGREIEGGFSTQALQYGSKTVPLCKIQMMDKDTLIKRLSDIEWDDFEVKKSSGELPKSAWETVCAFANTSGGWLVLGVSQTGKTFEVTGVSDPEKIEQDLVTTLRSRNKFNILINPECRKYDIDGKTVLAFYIPSAE